MTTIRNLSQKKCQPCDGVGEPFTTDKANEYLQQLPNWKLAENGKKISRDFVMKNFWAAVNLINQIAKIAEAENHHPDIHLVGYRKLKVELSTHAIGGLSENDFIEAAKINELPAELKP